MTEFMEIIQACEPSWIRAQQEYALGYEETRHRIRASWIPFSVDDDQWIDLYVMAESVEQDIALI